MARHGEEGGDVERFDQIESREKVGFEAKQRRGNGDSVISFINETRERDSRRWFGQHNRVDRK